MTKINHQKYLIWIRFQSILKYWLVFLKFILTFTRSFPWCFNFLPLHHTLLFLQFFLLLIIIISITDKLNICNLKISFTILMHIFKFKVLTMCRKERIFVGGCLKMCIIYFIYQSNLVFLIGYSLLSTKIYTLEQNGWCSLWPR